MKYIHPFLFSLSVFCLISSRILIAQNIGGPHTHSSPDSPGSIHAPTIPSSPMLPKWEYMIWEVRMGGGGQRLPEYCLHLPNGSSRAYHDWSRAFLDRGIPIVSSSRVDDVNALNSLGFIGWELITIAVKEEDSQRVLYHYLKRLSASR